MVGRDLAAVDRSQCFEVVDVDGDDTDTPAVAHGVEVTTGGLGEVGVVHPFRVRVRRYRGARFRREPQGGVVWVGHRGPIGLMGRFA